ncbi:hypothetical protein COOONC_15839 [Cooperia oncophora]
MSSSRGCLQSHRNMSRNPSSMRTHQCCRPLKAPQAARRDIPVKEMCLDHTFVAAFFLLGVATRFSVADHTTCHPIFSEISSLSFATSSDTQFIELSLSEACHKGHSQRLNLNKYGLLVLETKPILLGEPDAFTVKSFVDFNNKKWEKKKGKLEDFYVVGSSLEENSRIDFKFYEFSEKVAKCSRFVNWPNCNKKVESTHGKSITDFFSGRSTTGNNIYITEKREVSRSSQEWLSSRIKSFVAFAHTQDRNWMLPSERLEILLPSRPALHVLPYKSLDDKGISVSHCGSDWALTAASPRQSNVCSGEKFKRLLKMELAPAAHQPCIPAESDMDIGSSDQASDDDRSEVPAGHGEPMDVNDAEEVVPETMETREQCILEVIRLKRTINDLLVKIETVELELRMVREELREKNTLTSEALELAAKVPWLAYYRDPSRPNADFMRCKLCNRHTDGNEVEYNPDDDHKKCDGWKEESINRNTMGRGSVLCIKRFFGRGTPITRLLQRIKAHESSTEHNNNFRDFHNTMGSLDYSVPQDVEATVSSTLTAYTIAKERLPLAKQFPLLLLGMRAGAAPTTAHYDSTTAQRMIQTFAEHMKYDILKYVVDTDSYFSLLTDGTSNEGVKLIVFLLRTVSPLNRPITFHLALVEVKSESAHEIVEAFTNYIKGLASWAVTPGLDEEPYSFAMRRMVALSSDGASVMDGIREGVHAQLKQLIRKETNGKREHFLLSVCGAHKLNLVVRGLKGAAFNLTQAVVTEMHNIFGSSLGTRARAIYFATATSMGFPHLQMDALHLVRWSASLQASLSKILRVYPVLIRALYGVIIDGNSSPAMKKRAEAARFALSDARTFIILHHVNATLSSFARFSEALQDEEALMVDFLSRWRQLSSALEDDSIKTTVYHYLARSGFLQKWDRNRNKYVNPDQKFLRDYCMGRTMQHHSDEGLTPFDHLGLNPRKFPDCRAVEPPSSDEHRTETADPLRVQMFRNPAIIHESYSEQHSSDSAPPKEDATIEDSFTLAKVYRHQIMATCQTESLIDNFYTEIHAKLGHYMDFRRRITEAPSYFPYALDRHILLDIIECNGDYENFKDCVLPNTSRENRGYPDYMTKREMWIKTSAISVFGNLLLKYKHCAP